MEQAQAAVQDGQTGALLWGQRLSGTLLGPLQRAHACPAHLGSGIDEADPVLVDGN